MCQTFFEIFRFFLGFTHVFYEKNYFCSIKSSKSIIMQKSSKAIATIILTIAVVCAAGCNKNKEPNNGTYNGHDYVDLGLPRGTLWATCNVGADTPEGYGDHVAWGETQPKAVYTDSNYLYTHGGYFEFTKYCTKPEFGYNGFTDNLKTLQPSDDAATVNWGEGWRTPTINEWIELVTKCSYTFTTRNGVNGCVFTGRNGNSIFLPVRGRIGDDKSSIEDDIGNYWSSSLNKGWPVYAKGFQFIIGFDDCDIYNDFSRCAGYSVRPVRVSK